MKAPVIRVRELNGSDKKWITSLLEKEWGSTMMISRGKIHNIDSEPGFIATLDDERKGLITCQVYGKDCEITFLQSVTEGIGRCLANAVKNVSENAGCTRLWVITTNDNLNALGFYQKIGFVLKAVYPNALEESRKHKKISRIGENGIPLRDEIELEMHLNGDN